MKYPRQTEQRVLPARGGGVREIEGEGLGGGVSTESSGPPKKTAEAAAQGEAHVVLRGVMV